MSQANPITPDPDSALAELARDPLSRKRFMRMAGPGAAAALTVLLAACGGEKKRRRRPPAVARRHAGISTSSTTR